MTDKTLTWDEKRDVLLEGLDGRRKAITKVCLENEKQHLLETFPGSFTALSNDSVAAYDKVIFPVIRRVLPALIAMELVGVQPMNAPVGIVRALRVQYAQTVATNQPFAGEEASSRNLFKEYSFLANADTDYTTIDAFTTPFQFTEHLEHDGGKEMNIEVLKQTVEAKSRKLQAKWTLEAAEDLRALHSIDIEQELVMALSDEMVRELDREILDTLASLAGGVSTFDFSQADGRYASERFTALIIGFSNLSNEIAVATRIAGANWIVVSPNVLVALRHANNSAFTPAQPTADMTPASTLFVGTMNGSIRVFVDILATQDYALLGYKGVSDFQTGLVYSPYIPLMSSGVVTDPTTFDPLMGVRTRYALTSFTNTSSSLGNSGDFYRRATVTNLVLGIS